MKRANLATATFLTVAGLAAQPTLASAQAVDCGALFAEADQRRNTWQGRFGRTLRDVGTLVVSAGVGYFAYQQCRERLGERATREDCIGAGFAIGALTGSALEAALQPVDQRELLVSMNTSLLENRPQTLRLAASDACARTQLAETPQTATHQIQWAVAPNVELQGVDVSVIGQAKEVSVQQVNVRARPTTSSTSLAQLPRGSVVMAMGRPVSSPDWVLVGRGGVALGYVSARMLRDTNSEVPESSINEADIASVQVATTMTCATTVAQAISSNGRDLGEVRGVRCSGPEGLPISVG